jgi:hypothetical protein
MKGSDGTEHGRCRPPSLATHSGSPHCIQRLHMWVIIVATLTTRRVTKAAHAVAEASPAARRGKYIDYSLWSSRGWYGCLA